MLSYSRGPDEQLWELSISELLEQTADRHGSRPALISFHQSERLTWQDLLCRAERLAHGLQSLGLGRGDRVGLWSTNCIEWVVIQMACARAGLILVNVNPAYRSHELAFVLRKSRMKALFLWESDARANYRGILDQACGEKMFSLQQVVYFGTDVWVQLLDSVRFTGPHPDCNDVANIQYTSGTTGSPKGVMLTHRNLVNNGKLLAHGMRYTDCDCICVPVPLYHCFGSVIGTMSALASGAGIVLPNWSFDPRATLAAVQAEKATALYGVPAMFIAELNHPEFQSFDLASLRTGMMAGAPCPVELMKRLVKDMHCPQLTIGYGQTESSPVVTMSELDDALDLRVSTIGKALPCTEMKVISITSGETVPTGTQGEVCARGYMVMKGYDDEPEATARAIDAEGWLHTGDLGVMREDGYINLTGRAKDMIIRGGENVYPREVEEFLYSHPKVSEVQVVGLPDERLGETVLAWIRLRPGEAATAEEVRAFCEGKIAYFKVPEHIRFVEEFPMTVTGKIQKYRIREIETRERGLERVVQTRMA